MVMSLLMFALALLWQTSAIAQVALLPLYQNGRVAGTYSEISGGVLLGTTTSDDEVFVDPTVPAGTFSGATGVGIPIGFDFTFNGVVYDRLAVNNNGWICLGSSTLTPSVNTGGSILHPSVFNHRDYAIGFGGQNCWFRKGFAGPNQLEHSS